MNVTCPNCATVYRVDPAKVPATGVRARCKVCSAVFAVRREQEVPATPAQPAAQREAPKVPVQSEAPKIPSPSEPAKTAPVSEPEAGRSSAPPVTSPKPASVPASAPAPAAAPRPFAPQRPSPATPAAPTSPVGQRPAAPASPASPAGLGARPTSAPVPQPAITTPPKPAAPAAPPASPPQAAPTLTGSRPANPFLSQDPALKARRLARALISDMVVYHPGKRQEGLRDGNLKNLFEEEIKKSWEEYAEQVGREVADSTPYFREALNEILAGGRQIF
jgi:predicted Zn finger-like uncharacterized protein